MATLVLTVIGEDRPGLVSALSGVIAQHGGSWERSELSRLAGKFAGIVVVALPDARAAGLGQAVAQLADQGLEVRVERGRQDAPAARDLHRLQLELVGADRPGIVHDVSRVLADREVSIEELRTGTREAPMAGGMLFEASATLLAPQDVPLAELVGVLEELANELMVDLTLSQE